MSGAWNSTRWLSAPRGSFKPAPGVALAPHLQLVRPVTGAHDLNVWVADQLTLQIEVAVKFAPRDAAVSTPPAPGVHTSEAPPKDVHRFLRQARAAAKIADPHLLQILEQGGVKGGIPFIVTELLEGKSLSQRLLSGPFAISHAHAVLSQAAGVLAKAHPLGLWHGSLCPEHLFLIEAAGRPFLKLANFGDVSAETWANEPASQLAPDAPSRRQAYLAPEQLLQGAGSSAAADIWALGVLLYELLTTTLPFEAPTSAGVSVAICNAQFSPPSHYRADLPPAVDAWFSRVFAKEPSARLLDASTLASEFGRAIGAAGVHDEAATPDVRAVLKEDDYDADERTMRWDLPSDWALPHASSGSLPSPSSQDLRQHAERPSVPSSGPPPLPDRPPSSRPPPPFPGYAPALSLRAPTGRLPSLPPEAGRATLPSLLPGALRATLPDARRRSFAQRSRFSKAQGLAAGALLGGALAFLAWGVQSWPEGSEATREASAETLTAPLAAAAASAHPLRTALPGAAPRAGSLRAGSRRPGEPSDTENLPVILQTDELPRAPEETDEDEDSTGGTESSAAARAPGGTGARAAGSTSAGPAALAAAPGGAKSDPKRTAESTAKPDPSATAAVALAKPKLSLASAPALIAPARRETPHRSPKQLSASADCNPPYFFDKNNIRRLKLECL